MSTMGWFWIASAIAVGVAVGISAAEVVRWVRSYWSK